MGKLQIFSGWQILIWRIVDTCLSMHIMNEIGGFNFSKMVKKVKFYALRNYQYEKESG